MGGRTTIALFLTILLGALGLLALWFEAVGGAVLAGFLILGVWTWVLWGRLAPYTQRRATNTAVLALSYGATGLGIFCLVLILGTLIWNGLGAVSIDFFTESTPASGSQGGGMLNAIYGSAVMTIVATLVGSPVGILAGTFLAEYGRGNLIAPVIRFINDILLSAPSIIIGLFVYEAMVLRMGHFSGWAGSVALAILVVPVVVRTTEDMLNLVPGSLREAAFALGTPKWRVIVTVTYRAAMQGMLTGVMLAVARISGETAPLLFTAVNNQFWTTNMNDWMPNLPVAIFQFALSPDANWQRLAWGGALLITVTILALNIVARVLTSGRSFGR
ncbi:MAG TPA: phosphate ABC transporter permease PstA [Stellaceae bacterium]|nr:phosphate ABC transporter permease PstA [Stellaceae bacterium]